MRADWVKTGVKGGLWVGKLPNGAGTGRIASMDKAEIKEIAAYIKDIEKSLYEWDHTQTAMQTEYAKVYQTIERLMQATFKTKDQKLKPFLATLELKARKCLDCIERRTKMRN